MANEHFFRYELRGATATGLRLLGVRRDRDGVTIAGQTLTATFGFLHLRTPLSNIAEMSPAGPYQWIKTIGPRLSMADHGLTFGTTSKKGVCLQFVDPVARVIGPWDHPNFTVTVEDPTALCAAIDEARE